MSNGQKQDAINRDMAKVAFVVFEDICATNGYTNRLRRVLELLNGSIQATVIASSDRTLQKIAGFEDVDIKFLGKGLLKYQVTPFPLKLVYILLWNIKLAITLLINKYDVVFSVWDPLGFPSVFLVSKIMKYKVILEVHDIFSIDHIEGGHSGILLKLDQILEKFVVEHAGFVIALSQNTLEFYKPYNDRMELVLNFVDTNLFRATNEIKTTDSVLVGLIGPIHSGHMRENYYVEFLYSRIEDFDRRINFLVIGHCDNKISHNRIRYTGYIASEKEYAHQISQLDAVLVPEKQSTTGPLTKLLEPMSCGVPVFATPKALIGLYWVEPGKDIFIFEENEISEKVNEYIFNVALMAEIGKNCRKVVEQYYSKSANKQKLLRILQSVIMHH
jgi:glycosyltransferase involved in cell wall biosynthesis